MKRYDWQTVVIVCVGAGCMTAVLLLGKGHMLQQILTGVGGLSGVAALLKYSPLHGAPDDQSAPKS